MENKDLGSTQNSSIHKLVLALNSLETLVLGKVGCERGYPGDSLDNNQLEKTMVDLKDLLENREFRPFICGYVYRFIKKLDLIKQSLAKNIREFEKERLNIISTGVSQSQYDYFHSQYINSSRTYVRTLYSSLSNLISIISKKYPELFEEEKNGGVA